MGSLRFTLCTAVLAMAALTPAAHAADAAGAVSLTPAVPTPGSDVTLRVSGCTGTQGTASSSAFVADAALTGGEGGLTGETRVRSSVQPGAYEVRVTCGDSSITGRVTVAQQGAGGLGAGGLEQLLRPPSESATPVAPVQAGGGGTAHFATVATSGSGPGSLQAVTGLLLAGLAAAGLGLRARRSRGTR